MQFENDKIKKGDVIRRFVGLNTHGPYMRVTQVTPNGVYCRWLFNDNDNGYEYYYCHSNIHKINVHTLFINKETTQQLVNGLPYYIDHAVCPTWIKASYANCEFALFKFVNTATKTTIYATAVDVTRLIKQSPVKQVLKVRIYLRNIIKIM